MRRLLRQDNKCSWLVVQALEHASEAQRAVLKARAASCHPPLSAAQDALDPEEPLPERREARLSELIKGAALLPRSRR